MALFMDMGLGLKNSPPRHENIPRLEFSLGLGHKNDIIHGYGLRAETPPKNIKIFQNWNSH